MLSVVRAIDKLREQMKANSLTASTIGVVDIVVSNITATASTDLKLIGVTGKDIIAKLTDAAGARKVLIKDSGDVTVASIDSDGVITGSKIKAPLPSASSATGGAPTAAEIEAAFGTAASNGAGFVATYMDTTETTGVEYLVMGNGTTYYTVAGTVAA